MKKLPTLAKKQVKLLSPAPPMTMMLGAPRRRFGQGPIPRADWTLSWTRTSRQTKTCARGLTV